MSTSDIKNACEEKACETFHRNIEMDGMNVVLSKINSSSLSTVLLFLPSNIFIFNGLPRLRWYDKKYFVHDHKNIMHVFIQENNY